MTEDDTFFSNVHMTDGCWLWTGTTHRGYGYVQFQGRKERAHRVIYEQVIGAIPEGLVLDHLCRVPACVRPDHLEAVTQRENLLRGEGWPATNAAKTCCSNGHELTAANVYIRPYAPTERVCRACQREYRRRYNKRAQNQKVR